MHDDLTHHGAFVKECYGLDDIQVTAVTVFRQAVIYNVRKDPLLRIIILNIKQRVNHSNDKKVTPSHNYLEEPP